MNYIKVILVSVMVVCLTENISTKHLPSKRHSCSMGSICDGNALQIPKNFATSRYVTPITHLSSCKSFISLGMQPLHLLVSLSCNSYENNCSEKKPQSLIRSNSHEDKEFATPV
ncbi:uncharacterized protein LOC130808966 isoform X1 [Amaranthus tricolor]|uniref:uncharacterized protein LOC130808966 isoform X1 n=1 Tax=Amaranthus tricolor TaxID=29722 RepID=UPI0025856FEF|nr:uncharacterized protein LOC130808966 isoform X1 [Amaranthus tricolor]